MANRTISATRNSSIILTDGKSATFTSNEYADDAVSGQLCVGGSVTFSSFRGWGKLYNFEVYIGGDWAFSTKDIDCQDSTSHTCIHYIDPESVDHDVVLKNSGEITVTVNDKYGVKTDDVCRFDDPCTVTIEASYEPIPTITLNSFSVSQDEYGKAKFSCKATRKNGSGNIKYTVKSGNSTVFSVEGASGSTITQEVDIEENLSYDSSYTFTLTAILVDYDDIKVEQSRNITFYKPSLSNPTYLTISEIVGQTASLDWTSSSLSNTTGTITYYIYKDGEKIGETSSPPYQLTEDITSTWGTSPVSLTVNAVATGLSNIYSGEELTSAHTNSVIFTYKIPYGVPGKTENLNVNGTSPAYIKYGETFTLNWSEASDGYDNPVLYYTVFRDGVQVETGIESTSWSNATAHSIAGNYYIYTVQAIGEHSSGEISDGLVVYSYSDPSIPANLTINNGSDAYISNNANATLRWNTASAGAYNDITGYIIYQDGVNMRTVQITEVEVPANTTPGAQHIYSVAAAGVRSNSQPSPTVIAYTYADPEPPVEVSVSNEFPDTNAEVIISWNRAQAGNYNAIQGYQIYESDSEDGIYTYVTEIQSTSASGFCTVTTPNEMDVQRYYKVVTVGVRSNSEYSEDYAVITTNAYTPCKPPTVFELDSTISNGEAVTLYWSGAEGGSNNDIYDYEIQYAKSSDGNTYSNFAHLTLTSENSIRVFPPAEFGGYYKYQIRVRGTKQEEKYYSEWVESSNVLNRTYNAPIEFTDEPLIARETPIKALHMQELQLYVNTSRNYYKMGEYKFTEIIAEKTSLADWTEHVRQIREAIDEIGKTHEAWIEIGVNCPTVAVMNQLRTIVRKI